MLFREVLPELVAELDACSWLTADHHVTVLRDLHGRVRVVVESPHPAVDGNRRDALSGALRTRLGDWLGDWLGQETPVWIKGADVPPTGVHAAMLDFVRQARRPWRDARRAGPWQASLLERHAGRRGWVGEVPHDPPWSLDEVDAGDRPAIVVFFSHKGGLGRSTALAATAVHLARAGQACAVVDLDLEAPGQDALFGVPVQVGVVDYLVEEPVIGDRLVATLDLAITDPTLIEDGPIIRLIPAGTLDADDLEMLARLDLQGSGPHGLTARIGHLLSGLSDQRPELRYILIDARTGFHDLGGAVLAGLCHGAVVLGSPSPQSWAGVEAVARVLARPAASGASEDPVPLVLVHAMAPPPGTQGDAEERAFRKRAYEILSTHYYTDPPDEADRDTPHWALPLRWRPELRGQGGALVDGALSALLAEEYAALAVRLKEWFGSGGDA